MILSEILNAMRHELQDTSKAIYTDDDELIRNVTKSVSLMSRLLPDLAIVESTIGDDVTAESLVISSGAGTIANAPIEEESETLSLAGVTKARNTDYEINYLTGAVTGLSDDDTYSIKYNLDDTLLDISSIVTDCIRIQSVEYPLGTKPTYSIEGDYLRLKGSNTFTANEKLRITYLKRFDAPKYLAVGTYKTHLDEIVMVGAVGHALFNKADYYTHLGATNVAAITTLVTTLGELSITLPDVVAFPDVSLPADPSLSFTTVETALGAVATAVGNARTFLAAGDDFLNEVNAGRDVAEGYAKYATVEVTAAGSYVNEGAARLRALETELSETTTKLNRYRIAVEKYGADVTNYRGKSEIVLNEFNLSKARLVDELSALNQSVGHYINISERLRLKGMTLINQFFSMIGQKIEAQPIGVATSSYSEKE